MSNRRRPGLGNSYRSGFLRSPAWFARRDRWFRKEQQFGHPLGCVACGRVARADQLELHHLDYRGVRFINQSWRAVERHEDLVPLHPYCHELLHRLIDRDLVLSQHRSREAASALALERLRVKLIQLEESR